MNTNPPHIDEPITGDELKIIHIDRRGKTGLIKSDNMKYSQPVQLQDWLVDSIMHGDYVKVNKTLTGELIVTDYYINMEITGAIHNSIQDTLPEHERDYAYNERGELYE